MHDRKEYLTVTSGAKVLATNAERASQVHAGMETGLQLYKNEYWRNWACQDYVAFHDNNQGNQQSSPTEISI